MFSKINVKSKLKIIFYSITVFSITLINQAYAVPIKPPVKMGDLTKTIGASVISLGSIISDIALVSGVGFLLASFFKFDQHKKNPTQIPVSQPLTLLLIGAGLCLFPTIMPLVQTAAFGTAAQRGGVGTSTIKGLIGST